MGRRAMDERLQHPLDMSTPTAVDRMLSLWDTLVELERRRDAASGLAREAYDDALQLLYRAWSGS